MYTNPSSLVTVNCVAVSIIVALVAVTTGTMLAVTVPASVDAAHGFAVSYGQRTAEAGRAQIKDFLKILIDPYHGLAHATRTGLLPNFLNKTNLVQRNADLNKYRDFFKNAIFSLRMEVKDISAGFADRSFVNCVVHHRAEKRYRCWTTDFKKTTNGGGNGYDQSWWWTYNNQTRYQAGYMNPRAQEDIRIEPWYIDAPKTPDAPLSLATPYFSIPYVNTAIDLTMPFFGPTPANGGAPPLFGVTSFTIDAVRLSAILSQLPMTANTKSFLISQDGHVLAASTGVAMWTSEDTNYTQAYYNTMPNPLNESCTFVNWKKAFYCRFTPTELPGEDHLRELATDHPEIIFGSPVPPSPPPAAATTVPATTTTNPTSVATATTTSPAATMLSNHTPVRKLPPRTTSSMATRRVVLAGTPMFVTAAPLAFAGVANADWLFITMVPEADVVGEIIEGKNTALKAGGGTLAAAIVLCVGAVWLLLRPLTTVAGQMHNASTLQDDDLPASGPRSKLREVSAIQKTFYLLCGQLRRAKHFLPHSLLIQLAASAEASADKDDDDADEGDIQMHEHEKLVGGGGSSSGGDHHSVMDATARSGSSGVSFTTSRRGGMNNRDGRSAVSSAGSTASTVTNCLPIGDVVGYCPITRRHITVLALNAIAFHSGLTYNNNNNNNNNGNNSKNSSSSGSKRSSRRPLQCGSDAFTAAYGAMIDAVAAASAAERGVLDLFHGDRFFVTFNAVKACASHAVAGARAAFALCGQSVEEEGGDGDGDDGTENEESVNNGGVGGGVTSNDDNNTAETKTTATGGSRHFRLRAGLSSGQAQVGNLGSDALKRFAVVGSCYTTAAVLERWAGVLSHDIQETATPTTATSTTTTTTTAESAAAAGGSGDAVSQKAVLVLADASITSACEGVIEFVHLDLLPLPPTAISSSNNNRMLTANHRRGSLVPAAAARKQSTGRDNNNNSSNGNDSSSSPAAVSPVTGPPAIFPLSTLTLPADPPPQPPRLSVVSAIRGAVQRGGDEWMYELEAAAAHSPFGRANAAFRKALDEGIIDLSGFPPPTIPPAKALTPVSVSGGVGVGGALASGTHARERDDDDDDPSDDAPSLLPSTKGGNKASSTCLTPPLQVSPQSPTPTGSSHPRDISSSTPCSACSAWGSWHAVQLHLRDLLTRWGTTGIAPRSTSQFYMYCSSNSSIIPVATTTTAMAAKSSANAQQTLVEKQQTQSSL